jgi:hypothetical protein
MTDQTINTEEMYDKLRRSILDWLRQQEFPTGSKRMHREYQIRDISHLLTNIDIPQTQKERLGTIACQILHELYFERIIIPGMATITNIHTSHPMEWPFFIITDYGRQVLQTSEYSPYDPDGYLRRLKLDITNIDETIIRYVEESLRCLHMNCLLASAVTIGAPLNKQCFS